MVSATTGAAHQDHMPRMTAVQRGANMAARPFSALVGVTRRGGSDEDGESRQQQSALVGGESGAASPTAASPPRHELAARHRDPAVAGTRVAPCMPTTRTCTRTATSTCTRPPAGRRSARELTPGDPLWRRPEGQRRNAAAGAERRSRLGADPDPVSRRRGGRAGARLERRRARRTRTSCAAPASCVSASARPSRPAEERGG